MKAELKRRGMEQAELAEAVGTTAATISRMLSGKQASAKHAAAVSEKLGVPNPMTIAGNAVDFEWARLGAELDVVDIEMKRRLVRKVRRYIKNRRDLLAGSEDDEDEREPDDTK